MLRIIRECPDELGIINDPYISNILIRNPHAPMGKEVFEKVQAALKYVLTEKKLQPERVEAFERDFKALTECISRQAQEQKEGKGR